MPRAQGPDETLDTLHWAACVRIVCISGQVFGMTTCSRDLVIGGVTYKANSGLEPTAVEVALGLEVDNTEISGFLLVDNWINAQMVRAGVLDGATVYKFIVDYNDPGGPIWKLLWGVFGEVQLKGEIMFIGELRGSSQWLAANIVPLTQATCRAVFGDPVQCKAVVHTNDSTVTGVTSLKKFIASGLIGARADGFFDHGYVRWNTGLNAGQKMDVRHYNQATGEIMLMADAVLPIAETDTFTAFEGCNKTRPACISKGNILNMDAEPDVPGNDQMLHITKAPPAQ